MTIRIAPGYWRRWPSSQFTVSASRWLVGSSSSSSSGFSRSSLHSATRRFSPPESRSTAQSSGGQPSASIAWSTWLSRSHRPCASISSCKLRHLVRSLVRIVHGEFVVAVEDRLLGGDAEHHVAAHVERAVELRLLRQVADARALGDPRLAVIFLVHPGHDLQQGGLARAVDAEHADLGVGVEGQVNVVENLLAAGPLLGEALHMVDELPRHRRVRPVLPVNGSWRPFSRGRALNPALCRPRSRCDRRPKARRLRRPSATRGRAR